MMNIISLGAGVQSSTMALMAAKGEIGPMPDAAIFADTGAEPAGVYRWLDWLETQLPFHVYRVSAGNLRDDLLAGMANGGRVAKPPLFVAEGGMLHRQCTNDYKIAPIQRKVRELMGLKPRQRAPKEVAVTMWMGVSLDEIQRMTPSRLPYIRHHWPLIDAGMTRGHCLEWMARHGYPMPPKSACTFCPYHDDRMWSAMKTEDPESWAEAVRVDEAIRAGTIGRKWFLHRERKPLAEVEFRPRDEQVDMFDNECAGICGV